MTYRDELTMLVQNQVGTGATLKDVLEPLINMAASSLVNICHYNKHLDLEDEKDVLHATLDHFVEVYEEKYNALPTVQ